MINVSRNNDPWFHLCLLVTAQKRVMSIQYHILSQLKLNAFFWHSQLQCISIVWHPDSSHLLYMKTNDGLSVEEVSGWCSLEDAMLSLLTWPYRPHPHLCVTDRLCREFDPGGMHPVSTSSPGRNASNLSTGEHILIKMCIISDRPSGQW